LRNYIPQGTIVSIIFCFSSPAR